MNIETVNELIASLESAGELSIKERKYLELAKAYQQLAAENVGLKSFGDTLFDMYKGLEISGGGIHDEQSVVCQQAALDAAMSAFEEIETPATDAYLAGIKADGVEEFAAYCGDENSVFVEAKAYYRSLPDAAYEFCVMLREGTDK
ncbi:hypothetical protein RZP54_06475 [Raoultella ornithinolytica]|uniref:hypothetical protein n=1 Tax=Raoultella ornithinolytica TaxID=54291 RepID=UPI001A2B9D81|nr:hypothetical protein [Raoultella ornithinolytica]MDC7940750.1 hypothetical protein [Raoultella ornithinolytica]MDV0588637.1 hypothetical protein [Raoultella ornithinolytica]HAT1559670.1 hypothetical protein [Raoultella ornithinolytica]